MPPKLLSQWFSSAVLKGSSARTVTDPVNQFVIGTPGSGKTMLMRMLTFAVQREIVTGDHHASLPLPKEYLAENKQYLGIYFSFDDFRRQSYDDGRLTNLHAIKALEDYIATRLVLDLLEVIGDDTVARLGGTSRDLKAFVNLLVTTIRPDGIDITASDWNELLEWFQLRLGAHHRFVRQNDEDAKVPTGLQVIGAPHVVAEAARKIGLLPISCALYVIIDQADNALGHETGATVLKNAILSAARQQMPLVYLKVGLRRRSLVEMNISAPNERHFDREMQHIDIDSLTRQGDEEYKNWLIDICRRRLSASPALEEHLKNGFADVEKSDNNILRLSSLSVADEAHQVVGRPTDATRHIRRFCEDWERLLGLPKNIIASIGDDVFQRVGEPLDQMFVLIKLSRLLYKMALKNFYEDPRDKQEYNEAFDLDRLNRRDRSRTKWSQPAIFQLIKANVHQNSYTRKIYAGFDCLAECSERNVSHFIETVGRILDQAPRDKRDKIVLPIPIATQTSVVHFMSDAAWREMIDVSTQGARVSILLEKIAAEYRTILMLPWLPVLNFSAFDLTVDPQELIRVALDLATSEPGFSSERTLGLVLREALSAGYLRYEIKNNGGRYRVRINRIFMPRLELPTQSQQAPPVLKSANLLNFFKPSGKNGEIDFNLVDPLIGARQQPLYKQSTLSFWDAATSQRSEMR